MATRGHQATARTRTTGALRPRPKNPGWQTAQASSNHFININVIYFFMYTVKSLNSLYNLLEEFYVSTRAELLE